MRTGRETWPGSRGSCPRTRWSTCPATTSSRATTKGLGTVLALVARVATYFEPKAIRVLRVEAIDDGIANHDLGVGIYQAARMLVIEACPAWSVTSPCGSWGCELV